MIRLSRPFLYQPLACVTVLSLLVTFLGAEYGYANLDVAADISLGVGTPLALLLAFRLNISYTRWLEARTLWGKLVESSRSIVSTAVSATLAKDGCGGEEARATKELKAAKKRERERLRSSRRRKQQTDEQRERERLRSKKRRMKMTADQKRAEAINKTQRRANLKQKNETLAAAAVLANALGTEKSTSVA